MKKKIPIGKAFKTILELSLIGIGTGVLIGSFFKILEVNKSHQEKNKYSFNQKKNKIKRGYSLNNNLILNERIINQFNYQEYSKKLNLLSSKWEKIKNKYNDLEVSAFLLIIDNNQYAELQADNQLPAASTIKIPILITILRMLDQGEVSWNEPLKLEQSLIGKGAGWMAYEAIGTKFPMHEVVSEMIRISDNTAANLLIKRVGGISSINQHIKKIGLKETAINNYLPDLKGTNKTSARDLAITIALIDNGSILSPRSRDLFREIMENSKPNTLIPQGVLKGLDLQMKDDVDYLLSVKGYKVYNKTGDIGISYADAGLIQMPNNTRVVASFIVKGPFNDPRSPQLIRELVESATREIKPLSMLSEIQKQ
tara:strand:+ start:15128 stop:16234 length:1107 start_codon:yes stop_codon:yes gene_type:complete